MASARSHTIEWNGRRVPASVPPLLADLEISLPERTVRATERAIAAVERASDQLPNSWEPLARLLLRSEGVASSAFEQIKARLEEVAAAEVAALVTGPSAWVADNLAVVSEAVSQGAERSLSIELMLEWHTRLMEHATTQYAAELIGRYRNCPVWIGGSAPTTAAYVAPPHELVPGLMEDLVAFANDDRLDAVTQAAVLHAQFESIHPFADGNGRLGRVLIGWCLVRRLRVRVPPPFSVFVAKDPGGYLSGLVFFREDEVARWVEWFATTLDRSATAAASLVVQIEALMGDWRRRASAADSKSGRPVRRDAIFWAVLEMLPAHPVVSSQLVVQMTGVSSEGARRTLKRLESLGILEPIDLKTGVPGRPVRWMAAAELVETVARWT
ncbi:MAG: Fic family protein [Acidimicrobiales bacterium]